MEILGHRRTWARRSSSRISPIPSVKRVHLGPHHSPEANVKCRNTCAIKNTHPSANVEGPMGFNVTHGIDWKAVEFFVFVAGILRCNK